MGISEQAEGGIVLFRGIYTPLVGEAERDIPKLRLTQSKTVVTDVLHLTMLLFPLSPPTWILRTPLFFLTTIFFSPLFLKVRACEAGQIPAL